MMLTAKYVRVRLTNIRYSSVTYVIWTVSSHSSPPSQFRLGNVPYVPLATPYPMQQHNTFAFPEGGEGENKTSRYHKTASLGCSLPFTNKKLNIQTLSPEFWPEPHVYAHDMGSGL